MDQSSLQGELERLHAASFGWALWCFLFCPDDLQHLGVTLTDTSGSSWTFIHTGFGPDWNPATQP